MDRPVVNTSSGTGFLPTRPRRQRAVLGTAQVDSSAFIDRAKSRPAGLQHYPWKCQREFALLTRDCVEFLRAVGDALEVEMPTRNLFRFTPRAYVRALLAAVTSDTLTLPGATYEGTLLNGQPFGHGILTFDDASRIDATFRGLDHHTGAGRLLLDTGYTYEGAIVDYKAHGRGTIASATSALVLTGMFEEGVLKKVIRGQRRGFKDAGPIEAVRTGAQTHL